MECEECVAGVIDAIEGWIGYNSVVGQPSWLHGFWFGDLVLMAVAVRLSKKIRRLKSAVDIVRFETQEEKEAV